MHSEHCKRNPQQDKIRFVAESTSMLLFFDLLCFFGFHGQIAKILYRSKSLQKCCVLFCKFQSRVFSDFVMVKSCYHYKVGKHSGLKRAKRAQHKEKSNMKQKNKAKKEVIVRI